MDFDKSKVTFIEIEKKYNLILCGTYKGSILIFNLKNHFTLHKGINDHSKKINCIQSHSSLNMFIDCSDDGFVNIYTLPKVKFVSSVYLKDNVPIYSFLSMIPVPCFIVYVKNKFILYDLKGIIIQEKNNIEDIHNLPIMKVDLFFNEYISYNHQLMKIFFFDYQ